ncbi:MAG: outer membrane protein transport protein [Bacteroidia bacterium]|nr:outer membrane protein transport protein [Bacteroidia bacterium]
MRKLLTFIVIVLLTGSLFAGGLVTNTNQSAVWVRLPSRNASVGIDAAYYNPAGLMKLENGFHFSLSNQSIFQTREIENSYAGPGGAFGLNEHVYKGTVTAPVFPSIYAVYKMDKLAFSLGFEPVGGGAGALFEKGLPSFEISQSDLVPLLAASQGASAYRLDAYFKGSSIFLGFQGGISYKINDMLSVAAGLRYVTAKNTYEGHLTDIEVELPGGWTRADIIMTQIAAGATGAAAATTALVTGGAGTLTLAEAQTFGIITATQRAQLEGALTAFGYPVATPIAAADAVFKGAAAKYTATATLLGDQTADVAQTGSGVTPIISVNISPSENLNIALKYEMATKLDLKNKTVKDLLIGYTATGTPITMFPNGAMTRNDMPAMLTLGVDYKLSSSLLVSLGADYYFDKTADYGHDVDADLNSATPTTHIANKDIIASNGMSIDLGLEYNISEKLLVSGGYVWANKGVNSKYQSDLTYGLGTQTFGAGGAYNITDKIQINLGANYTVYKEDSKTIDHIFSGTGTNIPATESYKKNTFIVGVGLDIRF